jgi:hypothetical protein
VIRKTSSVVIKDFPKGEKSLKQWYSIFSTCVMTKKLVNCTNSMAYACIFMSKKCNIPALLKTNCQEEDSS